ncbi:pur operon repressor [Lactobacillus taiwanensis]|uniref:pur operon repressor n=1 Tax=Lactobacillus taiwanensis TaxID=508451 RepID=UPI000EC6CB28|nr:pur operon repressor [Lactobacillus taiwanensis]MCR1902384.1 pur operon repressor [Lactobacillus taiwanensis]MRM98143.1 pur operon repressor [Lactobacillus taiwanensis]
MKRSERLVDMVKYLLARPHTLIALPFFADRYGAAKSSISEDLAILRQTLANDKNGILETVAGAAGGVRYIPFVGKKEATNYLHDLADRIEDPDRILPGNFVYLSDILGSPQDLRQIGQLIATKYGYSNVDYVMTIETKGIAIAQAVSRFLNVPFVMVRRRPKITEGSTISVNYVASSSERVEKMELAKRLLPEGSNVLIVDDFMKGGGTLTGMEELVKEFKGTVAGMCVLCETRYASQKVVDDYQSLIKITEVDRNKKLIKVRPGNFLEQTDFNRFPK